MLCLVAIIHLAQASDGTSEGECALRNGKIGTNRDDTANRPTFSMYASSRAEKKSFHE